MMRQNSVETIWYEILMAGDLADAKRTCREYCMAVGLCVTIEPTTYIYAGGEEAGFRVRLIHYPRFPSTDKALQQRAFELAGMLAGECYQHSFTLMNATKTWWQSSRSEA